ncbi:MAG: dipicolinate synthase subunit B, partial [Candidatus Onthomonas sp.]|nr:dipicolinate synthase subunit B [Candidatus Onthomonas sp.]
MNGKELRVGFACTGSFCTFGQVFPVMEETAKRFGTVIPILSEYSAATDTRFGKAADFAAEMERICGRPPLSTITGVEPIGPEKLLDVLVIAPCTGNTLAKMAAGVTDSAVTMAAKAHLRNGRPVLLGISTNDGLAVSLRNLGELNCRKNIYLVP